MKKRHIPFLFLLAAVLFLGGMVTQRHFGLAVLVKWIVPPQAEAPPPPPKPPGIRPEHQGKLAIFILAGQSNMEGDGRMEDCTPIDTDGRVYVFDETYTWVEGREPVRNRPGPSIAFAKALIDRDTGIVVGIINVALGGTGILQWQKSLDDHSLYQNMIKRALAAGPQGELMGLLFYQGETEALGYTAEYDTWDTHFVQFVQDARHDLGQPELPVVFARVIPRKDLYWKNVRARQERVKLDRAVMVSTDDIGHMQRDNLHFTSKGYAELGKRLGEAYVRHFMTVPSH